MGLRNASSVGCQRLLIWGPVPPVAATKDGALDVGPNTLVIRKKLAGHGVFPPYCVALCWGCGVWWGAPQTFLLGFMWVFSHLLKV